MLQRSQSHRAVLFPFHWESVPVNLTMVRQEGQNDSLCTTFGLVSIRVTVIFGRAVLIARHDCVSYALLDFLDTFNHRCRQDSRGGKGKRY